MRSDARSSRLYEHGLVRVLLDHAYKWVKDIRHNMKALSQVLYNESTRVTECKNIESMLTDDTNSLHLPRRLGMMFSFWPWLFVFLAVSWDVDAAGTFTSSAKIELRANRADTLHDAFEAFSPTLTPSFALIFVHGHDSIFAIIDEILPKMSEKTSLQYCDCEDSSGVLGRHYW